MSRIAATDLPVLNTVLLLKGLQLLAVQCPDQKPPVGTNPGSPDGSEEASQRVFAIIANNNPDGKADIEVKVAPLAGPNKGKATPFVDPVFVDAAVAAL